MELRLRAHAGHQIVDLPWQKNAPSHWKLHRIKHLLREVDERTSSGDEPLLSLTRSRGLIRRSEVTDKPPSAKTLIGYKICRPGDIVMNRMQAWSGMFGLATELGIVSPDYAVLRLTSMTDGDFLLNLLKAPGPVSHFAALSTGMGSGFNRLYTDQLGAVPVVIPPYEEQVQIAAVIRRVDHRVNRLIRAKQRLIALLNEQKQAIIQRAVTRGLDPDVRLKPSGVEWLGEVPEHWEVLPLKRIARMRSGVSITALQFKDDGKFPVYGGNGLRGYAKSYTHDGDFVLIGRQGALCGNVNYARGKFWASEHAIVVTLAKEHDIRWFGEMVRAMNLNQYSQSAAQPGLSVERIQNVRGPVPPPDEQRAISRYLSDETIHIDQALSVAHREIQLIQEYRTRLIADVVTGKLDVRGVEVLDEDHALESEPALGAPATEEELLAYAGE